MRSGTKVNDRHRPPSWHALSHRGDPRSRTSGVYDVRISPLSRSRFLLQRPQPHCHQGGWPIQSLATHVRASTQDPVVQELTSGGYIHGSVSRQRTHCGLEPARAQRVLGLLQPSMEIDIDPKRTLHWTMVGFLGVGCLRVCEILWEVGCHLSTIGPSGSRRRSITGTE